MPMASPPARLVISAVESQDRSFTCLNRLRSVVRPSPSLIEFNIALLLPMQPTYRSGSQDHKENVTLMASKEPQGRLRPSTIAIQPGLVLWTEGDGSGSYQKRGARCPCEERTIR